MLWKDPTTKDGFTFKQEALPPAQLQALKDSKIQGLSTGVPQKGGDSGLPGSGASLAVRRAAARPARRSSCPGTVAWSNDTSSGLLDFRPEGPVLSAKAEGLGSARRAGSCATFAIRPFRPNLLFDAMIQADGPEPRPSAFADRTGPSGRKSRCKSNSFEERVAHAYRCRRTPDPAATR